MHRTRLCLICVNQRLIWPYSAIKIVKVLVSPTGC